MGKLAILIMMDGSHSSVSQADKEIMPFLSKLPKVFGSNGTTVKIARWNPDNPEEVKYHAGRFVQYLAKAIPVEDEDYYGYNANGEQAPEGTWAWFKRVVRDEMNKPIGANRKPSESRLK